MLNKYIPCSSIFAVYVQFIMCGLHYGVEVRGNMHRSIYPLAYSIVLYSRVHETNFATNFSEEVI